MHRLAFVLGHQLDYFIYRAEFGGGYRVEDLEFVGLVEDAVEAAGGGGEMEDVGDGGAGEEDMDEEFSR